MFLVSLTEENYESISFQVYIMIHEIVFVHVVMYFWHINIFIYFPKLQEMPEEYRMMFDILD